MKLNLITLAIFVAPIVCADVTITRPNMELLNEDGSPSGVTNSTTEVKAMEKASKLGDGIYHLVRPTATIVVSNDVIEPLPPIDPPIEPPVEPPVEPPIEPNPVPVPPAPSGEMDARFVAILESHNLHDFLAMNNAEDVCKYTRPCVNKGEQNPHFTYDPIENAFKMVTDKLDISSKWQIRKYFPALNKDNAQKISFQWEVKYGEGYLSTSPLNNYKAFQLSNSGEGLMFEYQNRFSRTDKSAVALPTIRYYRSVALSESTRKDPLMVFGPQISQVSGGRIDNWQPGGDTAAGRRDAPFTAEDHLSNANKHFPYILRANLWTRYTTEFNFSDGELRVKIWMSDEETPPTLVMASVADPGKGFLLSSDTSDATLSFQNWWIEMNSSQEGTPRNPLEVWIKNFVVYKNSSIPLD